MNETLAHGANDRCDTAQELLRAARPLFASHGYDGASVRQITAAAGANLGAITYHFGSKQELYNRVVAECIEPLAERVAATVAGGGTVMERLAGLVRTYFEHISSDEDTGRVLLQANVIGKLPPAAASAGIRRVHGALLTLVTEGQREGVFRAGDARLLSLSIISVPLHLALVRRALKANLGIDLDDAVQREGAILHAIRFVTEALVTHPGGNP